LLSDKLLPAYLINQCAKRLAVQSIGSERIAAFMLIFKVNSLKSDLLQIGLPADGKHVIAAEYVTFPPPTGLKNK
jgi:hypothetical protein